MNSADNWVYVYRHKFWWGKLSQTTNRSYGFNTMCCSADNLSIYLQILVLMRPKVPHTLMRYKLMLPKASHFMGRDTNLCYVGDNNTCIDIEYASIHRDMVYIRIGIKPYQCRYVLCKICGTLAGRFNKSQMHKSPIPSRCCDKHTIIHTI